MMNGRCPEDHSVIVYRLQLHKVRIGRLVDQLFGQLRFDTKVISNVQQLVQQYRGDGWPAAFGCA
jgi:hypothetical protein